MNKKFASIAVLIIAGILSWYLDGGVPTDTAESRTNTDDGGEQLAQAYDDRLHDEWVEASARVVRLLGDDNEGSRHQRFVVETARDQSLLIAHNIDLARRIPVAIGDRVRFRGVYEWNERGGVIHWTHNDPQGRIEGGYVEHQQKTYR